MNAINRKDIIEQLRALTRKADNRSKAAQVRDVMDGIEEALSRGVSRKAIVAGLAKNGLVMSLPTFDSIMQRYRKKRNASSAGQPVRSRTTTLPARNMPQEEDEYPAAGTSAPAALDSIINNTPDLASYARLAKENKRGKK